MVSDGNEVLNICHSRKNRACVILNPNCLNAQIGEFLQSTNRSNIQVIIYDHFNRTLLETEYPSNVVQIIPKTNDAESACAQIVLTARQVERQQLVEKRHEAVSMSLGIEKDLSKVINVYSTILDLGFDKVANLVRDHARRNRISMSHVVDTHHELLNLLSDTNFAESIRDCPIEAPMLRELTMRNRLLSRKRQRRHQFG